MWHSVVVNAPGDVLVVELVINRILIVKILVLYVHARRHFDVAFGGAGMYEEAVGPGGSRER